MPILKHFFVFSWILSFSFSPVLAADDFINYLAGIQVIRASKDLSEQEKAACYEKLVEITGIDAKRARSRIESYKNKPEQWKSSINEKILSVLEKPESDKE
jgi:hypothetical protein